MVKVLVVTDRPMTATRCYVTFPDCVIRRLEPLNDLRDISILEAIAHADSVVLRAKPPTLHQVLKLGNN